jgi:glycosyltransferase involved in cell wall biosynthesis
VTVQSGTRLALCHEWTTTYGGSDQVAARIASALSIDDVFTFAAEPDLAARLFPGRRVRAHRLGLTEYGRQHWQSLLPAMPRAWRSLDLSGYDAVVTSAHACVNAIRVPQGRPHVSYCHTPMRYAWDWRGEIGRIPVPLRPAWPAAAAALRRADRSWAKHVTTFVANSRNVADRIASAYGREAEVLHPPVDTGFFTPDDAVPREDFFLVAGRLVAYKRGEVAVAACAAAGRRLVVAGSGPELPRLREAAATHPGVTFVEQPSGEELRDLYRRARALLFPGVEDFGMTMVEAQACGTPVIALGRGGALEAVDGGVTGVLLEEEGAAAMAEAIRAFDAASFDRAAVRDHATRFSPEVFDRGIRSVLARALA